MKRVLLHLGLAGLLLVAGGGAPARAYHAATHAGLTERAALASSLHKRLIERLGRPLGLYEPLTLADDRSPARRELARRLVQLDSEGGYVPDRNRMTAIAWLTAGAVVEGVPAARTRHHFYDPSRQSGLDQVEGSALRTRLSSAASGVGSVRGVFTGESFDGSGMAAAAWLRAPDNDWGLRRFGDELERALAAPTAAERETALAQALLAAGAVLHLVEDMGDPALVRDDYRVALEADGGAYESFVSTALGRLGVPPLNGPPVAATTLGELFHSSNNSGLADRTHTRFFSAGTLPDSQRYPQPPATAGLAASGYAPGAVRHLARWERTPTGIKWSLDERVYRDYAAALLPETGRYAAGALEVLFRGRLEIVASGGSVAVTAHDARFGAGKVALYADVGDGPRRLVTTRDLPSAADGDRVLEGTLPPGTRRVAAVFRGVDSTGEPLVAVQELAIQ
jgi:hypothetical protein